MIKSEQLNDLFTALSKMQGELTSASKAKSGHGYKYADIAECINTAKEPLEKNGLAVSQMLGKCEQGTTLITILTHSSGQFIGSEFVMERAVLQGGAGKNPAQTMGASITYMRRYAYAAIIGLAQEDDDAAGLTPREKKYKENQEKHQKRNDDLNEQNKVFVSICEVLSGLDSIDAINDYAKDIASMVEKLDKSYQNEVKQQFAEAREKINNA